MLSVLVSWIIIFAASMIFGCFTVRVLYGHSRGTLWKPDIYLVCGLMVINVYAQIFSLFYKVGAMACCLLFFFGMICLVCLMFSAKREGRMNVPDKQKLRAWVTTRKTNILLMIICVAATLFWTTSKAIHYDTYLYHMQSIKWIEEYGVVPGLGNLHFRFAYNSAFMALQALFSMEWLLGQSLHTVNGYVCSLAVVYALADNRLLKNERPELSDLLKTAMIAYVYYTREYISSPNSDTLAMLLVLYICTKWSEFTEKDVSDALPYTYLCVLGVWAVTVKLSAGVCIVLAIYPFVLLMKRKQWKAMAVNICAGLFMALPWLARNIVISGYLLYPYPRLDFFSVDWKMKKSVVTFDAREIMLWGRGITDASQFDMPFWKWFPAWFQDVPRFIVVVGFGSAIALGIVVIYGFIAGKKQDVRRIVLFGYSILALFAWLFSAPQIRFGVVYLFIPICGVVWIILEWKKDSEKLQMSAHCIITLLMIPIFCIYLSSWGTAESLPKGMQENYQWHLTDKMELADGINIWYPVEGDQGSYDVFPCVPYRGIVEKIELRGDTLKDGFRIKEEYADKRLNGAGYEW